MLFHTGYGLKFDHSRSFAGARAAARGLRVTAEDFMGTQSIHVCVSPSSCGPRPPGILARCGSPQLCAKLPVLPAASPPLEVNNPHKGYGPKYL